LITITSKAFKYEDALGTALWNLVNVLDGGISVLMAWAGNSAIPQASKSHHELQVMIACPFFIWSFKEINYSRALLFSHT